MNKFILLSLCLCSILCNAQYQTSFLSDTVFVSSSELASNYTTPKVIIPAPGANKYIVPFKAVLISEFNTQRFTVNQNATYLMYTTASTGPFVTNYCNLLQSNTDMVFIPTMKGAGQIPPVNIINQPVVLRTRLPISGSGDLTAKVIVLYQIREKGNVVDSLTLPFTYPTIFEDTLSLTPLQAVTLYSSPQQFLPALDSGKFYQVLKLTNEIDLNVPTDCCSGGNAQPVYGNYQSPNGLWPFGSVPLNTSSSMFGIGNYDNANQTIDFPDAGIIEQPIYLQGGVDFNNNGQLAQLDKVRFIITYQIIKP